MIYCSNFIRPICHSDKFVDLQIAFLHYPSNLSVFTCSHGYIQPNVSGKLSINIGIQRTKDLTFDIHGSVHALQFLGSDPAVHFYSVDPG
jgi:hypothetical protein